MPKAGDLNYFDAIGEAGRDHAVNKPFSQPDCGMALMCVGSLLTLLPPAPKRVLECGCGTGWLSYLLQKHGYDVVATDVCEQAIDLARANPVFRNGNAPQFVVADSEKLSFDSEFDIVIYYDSLHHSVDEEKALRCAYRALKPGGICVAYEPGVGHAKKSAAIAAQFDTTEKDMPPKHVFRLGRKIGFTNFQSFARADHLARLVYGSKTGSVVSTQKWLQIWPLRQLALFYVNMFHRRSNGVSVMQKPATAGELPPAQAA